MSTTNITLRIDKELKKDSEDLFRDFGMSLTTALTCFMKQAVREQRIPFQVSRDAPNPVTIAAIEEVKRMKKSPDVKGYASFAEFMDEVETEMKAECDV